MSIQSKVNELNSIKTELKNLGIRSKKLREHAKNIENDIMNYLELKEQPGLKYKGTAIMKDTVYNRPIKKKNEARMDQIGVIKSYGIDNAEEFLDKLMDAKRHEPVEKTKLKIKKVKN